MDLKPEPARELFPVRDHCIYLNHAGVSPLTRPAAEMLATYGDEAMRLGVGAYPVWLPRLQRTRQQAARLMACDVDEVAMIKSTTRGIEIVATALRWNPGDVIVVEENTFPANWYPWQAARLVGAADTWSWPRRGAGYELADLESRLAAGGVRMVAVASAHFATGFRHDLAALARLVHHHGALLFVDAIQTLGAFAMPMRELGVDFASADSHKWLLGPESAGLLYAAREHMPLFRNDFVAWYGRSDFAQYRASDAPPHAGARRFEDGSPNVGGTMAMGESLALLNDFGAAAVEARVLALRDHLEGGLAAAGWRIISPGGAHRSGILAANRDGLNIDAAVAALAAAAGVLASNRAGNLRLAPHFYQTLEEMDRVITAVEGLR